MNVDGLTVRRHSDAVWRGTMLILGMYGRETYTRADQAVRRFFPVVWARSIPSRTSGALDICRR